MKICWIAPNGGNFISTTHMGSGGWIGALEKELLAQTDDIELSIIFPSQTSMSSQQGVRVSYFPVRYNANTKLYIYIRRIFPSFQCKANERFIEDIYAKIQEINPDIVHVWGVEHFYARIIKKLTCPHVVHIQGLTSSICDYYMPHTVSVSDLSSYDGFIKHYMMRSGLAYKYYDFISRVKNEIEVAENVDNWIGRTEWDRVGAYCLNNRARYFHCDELMRDDFRGKKWNYHFQGNLNITSIVGDELYKGIDVVLKTALVLKQMDVKFQWHLYGVSTRSKVLNFFEKKTGIYASDVNVKCHGGLPPMELANSLLQSDIYVHPSHIENSSNAIAEAMSLGLPIIAMYTGGNPTMLEGGCGILLQPGDSYMLAYTILQMRDKDYANSLSEKSYSKALSRHDSQNVVRNLLNIYREVLIR